MDSGKAVIKTGGGLRAYKVAAFRTVFCRYFETPLMYESIPVLYL